MSPPSAPALDRRPGNRRTQILAAAVELFCRDGFQQVSMGAVAEAVDIRPSSLYRHFPSKQRLLLESIRQEMLPWQALRADPAASIEEWADRLAEAALLHPRLGVLWQREARNLLPEERTELRGELRAGALAVERVITMAQPDILPTQRELLSWCAWAVVHSTSRHRSELPPPRLQSLVAAMLVDVFTLALPPRLAVTSPAAPAPAAVPSSRHEQLLAAAVALFARSGYGAVTIDAIGAAVGISGPSIYHHFADKQELLVTAVRRGAEWLARDLVLASAGAADPREHLVRLIRAYARFALEQHDLVAVLITESRHLDAADGRWARRAQQDTLQRLVSVLVQARPDVDAASARVRVHAALSLVNDLVRTPRIRNRVDVLDELGTVVETILLPRGTSAPPLRHGARDGRGRPPRRMTSHRRRQDDGP